MRPWLIQAAGSGATIVTASRRLARDLLEIYAKHQLGSGNDTWHTPPIRYWGDWLNDLFESADLSATRPTRIDHNAATILWERCLASSGVTPLLGFSALVRQSRQAWQRLQDWDVPIEELLSSSRSVDQQQFAQAARMYRELLRASDWIDPAMLPATVANLVHMADITSPATVTFAGFDRPAPIVERLIRSLRKRGSSIDMAPAAKYASVVSSQSCRDRQQEFRSAGRWARNYLERKPDARLGIVCPDLEADATAAARLVREGLAPGWQYAGEASRGAVNVSFGRQLTDFPAIGIALLVLRWINDGLSSREISVLLRSPFLASRGMADRSRIELELRRWPDRSWKAASFAALLRGKEYGRDWLRFVDRIVALRGEYRRSSSPAQWAEIIDRFLDEIGWPGDSAKDSAGYQLLERWRMLLGELAATGLVIPELPMSAAVERLTFMAAEVVFQPESSPGIVQLLGMLEATGLTFDALWISGLDATRWPPAPSPLALVSRQLQEKYRMPDATPADSLSFAETVLQHIAESATEVVMSWSMAEGDAQLSPSPLLSRFTLRATDSFVDPGWHAMEFCGSDFLLVLDADAAPGASSPESVAGGAHTIQMQTIDPFTAFARGRLGIREIPRFEPGLPAALKGSIAHRVLHALLADRPSSSGVASWNDDDLMVRIENALDIVIPASKRHLNPVHRQLLDLERSRLQKILRLFIDAERERPAFVVECVEQDLEFDRMGMKFRLRVDRIDRLADNTLLILDYKTGAEKSLLNRVGDVSDLQPVAYAIAIRAYIDGEIGGLALVNIDSRGVSYKGTGGSTEWDVKRRDDWEQRLASWIEATENALRDLARGDARINLQLPESHTRSLAILSRIGELLHDK